MKIILTTNQLILDNEIINLSDNINIQILVAIIKGSEENELVANIKNYIEKTEKENILTSYSKDYFEIIKLLEKSNNKLEIKNSMLYIKNFINPINKEIIDYLYKSYKGELNISIDTLLKFYELIELNPTDNKSFKNDIFKWFLSGDFVLTKNGNIIGYRAVDVIKTDRLREYASMKYLSLLKENRDPNNWAVIQKKNGEYIIVKKEKLEFKEMSLGSVNKLYKEGVNAVYTDKYTHTFRIKINEKVTMPREKCNDDPNSSCSPGLHIMNKNYGLKYGEVYLTCIISPYDIVAVPTYDNTKFRCCGYLPIGVTEINENGKLIEWEEGDYDMKEIENVLIEENLKHIENYKNEISKNFTNFEEIKEKIKNREIKMY